MTTLELRFLGGVVIRQDGWPLVALKSQKGQALLCYLAVTGKAHSRSALAGLLWADVPEMNAQTNLRKTLNRLKPYLSDRLLATRSTLAFDRDASHWLDVAEFEANVAARVEIDRLEKAIALYQGDFMDGFYLPDAPLFDEWMLAQRARLRGSVLRALHAVLTYFSTEGAFDTAVTYARRLLAIEPWDEEAHRSLMRVLVQSGQRSAALMQYETCRRILADELGVEPAAETVTLYNHIRANRLAVTMHRAQDQTDVSAGFRLPAFLQQEAKPTHPDELPFVARGSELANLSSRLDRALGGQGQAAFVIGEAGRGKTALLKAFIREAQANRPDLIAVVGNCSAYTGIGDPYLPFRVIGAQLWGDVETQWLSGAISREQAHRLWKMLPETSEALVKGGPDLLETFVPLSQLLARARAYAQGHTPWVKQLEAVATGRATAAGGVVMQPRLFEQYAEVLNILARRVPLLLVLDDLQWADLGSTSLLFHLGRQLTTQRLLILGTYRPVEVTAGRGGERHPLQPVVSEFQRRFGDIVLDLGLSAGQHFVEAFLDKEPNYLDAAFRERLYQRTRGHPLFTVELWQDMQERGAIMRDNDGRWIAGPSLDWHKLPTRVEATIGERINRLDEPSQNVLRIASVEGETFTAEVVAHVSGDSERATVAQLSRNLDKTHRLVRAEDIQQLPLGRLSHYKFRHILIQNYLYDSLDESERTYLHEAIGRELEATFRAESPRIALQLARHFRQAGMIIQAVTYLQQAGEQAGRIAANQEAIALCREALTLLQLLSDSPEKAQLELALQVTIGPALLANNGYSAPDVEATYARALELCYRLEDTTVILPILNGLWVYYLVRGNLMRSRELSEQLMALAESVPDSSAHLGAHFSVALSLLFLGDFEATYLHLKAAIALYDAAHHRFLAQRFGYDPGIMAHCYAALALWFLGSAEQAVALYVDALRMARDYANQFTLANCLTYAALLHHLCGNVQATSAYAEEALALSTKHGFAQLSSLASLLQAWVFVQNDHVAEGIIHMQEAMGQWEASGAELATAHYNCLLTEAYIRAGQYEQAWQVSEKAFTLLEAGPFWEAELHRLRGELLISRGGTPDEIEACFQHAFSTARRQGAKTLVLRAAISWSRWYAQLSRRAEAHRLLSAAYREFNEGFEMADLSEAAALLEGMSRER